jgi:hypothetical protein
LIESLSKLHSNYQFTMKTSLFTATILLLVVAGALAGRITPWGDPDITNPNTGRVTSMNLYLQLDTKLPAGHVMRITLPFSTTPSFATAGALVYTAASSSKGAFLSTTSLTLTATSNFVRASTSAPFHNYFTFNADLNAGSPYVLKLAFPTSSYPADTAGFLGYVQVETMSPALSVATSSSTANDTAITYDLNNAFSPIQIFAAPGNVSGFAIASDASSSVPGASSLRQMTFTPSQNFFYWPVIQLSWDSSTISVSNVISIDNGVNSTTVTPLVAGTGTNQYFTTSPSTTSLNIYHNAPLFTTQTIKYNFTTANPAPSAASPSVSPSEYSTATTSILQMSRQALQFPSPKPLVVPLPPLWP